MARQKFSKTIWWFLSLQMTLYLFLIFVQGAEESDDAFKNGKHLVLENFLPINFPAVLEVSAGREKRDVEGSGEDETVFAELKNEIDNTTENKSATTVVEGEKGLTNFEGSGEVSASEETSSEEDIASLGPEIVGTEDSVDVSTTTEVEASKESEEVTGEVSTETEPVTTEMIFDKSEDYKDENSTETTTAGDVSLTSVKETTTEKEDFVESSTTEVLDENTTFTVILPVSKPTHNESEEVEATTVEVMTDTTVEIRSGVADFTTIEESVTTTELSTSFPGVVSMDKTPEEPTQTVILKDITTPQSIEETTLSAIDVLLPDKNTTIGSIDTLLPKNETSTTLIDILLPPKHATPNPIKVFSPSGQTTPKVSFEIHSASTVGLPIEAKPLPTTPKPVVEEVFKQVKTAQEPLEAMPGNILRKENLTLGANPLLIVTNTRVMDSEETVQLSSSEPKRLGAYIVMGLILLSFFSLVGYITLRKRMNRKRQEFESNQESNDTEKALLSLSDYKDNSELEENHLKNNEITPIVVKSNTQLNKFEKNTNFSSPKNLNTIANEKNIEKDNVLKSTAENLTQVIIEDSPKDVEEDKNAPCMEKLIVKTRIDQDSIPKKPIIINRSSTGYIPIPQDNV